MSNMRVSEKGVAFIAEFEGKHTKIGEGRYRAYLDKLAKPPVWTIYAGVTHGVHEGMVVTEAEGIAMMQRELRDCETAVNSLVKVPLNQNQFDALVSFTYNCGAGALKRSSVLREVNKGNFNQVPAALALWNKAGGKAWAGLTRRRAAEGHLFISPVKHVDQEIERVMSPRKADGETRPVAQVVKESWTLKSAAAGLLASLGSMFSWLFDTAKEVGNQAVATQNDVAPYNGLLGSLGANMGKVAMVIATIALATVVYRKLTRP